MSRRNLFAVLSLLVLGFLTRALFFAHPGQAVFDEVYFGNFLIDYLNGEYFFDIHPPLGKLIIAFAGYLFGWLRPVDFSLIGDALPVPFIFLRLVPIFFGALLPALLFILARLLRLSFRASLLAGLLVVLESGLLVQSRFILVDSILLAFGFSALISYFAGQRLAQGKPRWSNALFLAAALFAALAAGVKWTGLSFVGLIGVLELIRIYRDRYASVNPPVLTRGALRERIENTPRVAGSLMEITRVLLFAAVFGVVYFLPFFAHLTLLPKSGKGDAFMSRAFQAGLIGSTEEGERRLSLMEKTLELNRVMFRANETVGTHPYGSPWYTWPLMKRPIYYWVGGEQKIYFFGNPVIYWFGGVAIVLLILSLVRSYFSRGLGHTEEKREKRVTALFIMGGYLINWIPFMFIGRVMFLYHYLAALMFSILAVVFFADDVRPVVRYGIYLVLALAALAFLYWSPLVYGTMPLFGTLEERFWFSSWR